MEYTSKNDIPDFPPSAGYQCAIAKNIFRKSDEKHIKRGKDLSSDQQNFKFKMQGLPKQEDTFDRKDLPILFKVTPESLVNLACYVIDKMPFPSVFEWTNQDVCKWIRQYGYPHYQNTFRVNNVTGRKLLLIGAQQLCAMNIRNFDDIKHITYGIRQIYGYQMVKFGRNKSLPSENYFEHHELYQTQSGPSYQATRQSDIWRKMQLVRPNSLYLQHWQLIDDRMYPKHPPEVFADAPRSKLYRCKGSTPAVNTEGEVEVFCCCSMKCICPPKRTSASTHTQKVPTLIRELLFELDSQNEPECSLPLSCEECTLKEVLNCLKRAFPEKYGLFRLQNTSS